MGKANLSIVGTALFACLAQTPAPAQVAASKPLAVGTTIPVMLEKGLDSRKNKVGDEVVAKTTENVKSDGQVVVPRGSKIVGRVTEIKARTPEEAASAIGIAFDRAVFRDGRQLPLALEIQAIAPAESATPPDPSETPAMAAPATPGQASPMGPRADPNAGTPGRIASQVSPGDGAPAGLSPSGRLTPSCHGVLGIDGLVLAPETTSSPLGSRIVSQRRNVHLDGRTQMMLRVTGT
jgi:hypothetical protein